jgi:hypothetical protein
MHGLKSRGALSTKQSKWSRSQPEKNNTLNPLPNSNNGPLNLSIISMMNGSEFSDNDKSMGKISSNISSAISSDSDDDDSRYKREYEKLLIKYNKLEQDHSDLKRKYENNENTEITKKVTQLDQKINGLSDRTQHIENICNSTNDLRITIKSLVSRIETLENRTKLASKESSIKNNIVELPSDFSPLTEQDESLCIPIEVQTFVPYINNVRHTARDNITKLRNNEMEILVEIVGSGCDKFIIFPFENQKNIPNFNNMILNMTCTDINDVIGKVRGKFYRNQDNIYNIELEELIPDNKSTTFTLPICVHSKTILIPK